MKLLMGLYISVAISLTKIPTHGQPAVLLLLVTPIGPNTFFHIL